MALKTLHATLRGHITPAQAAAELGLSERWVKKLVRRLRREGYRRRAAPAEERASKRKLSEEQKRRTLEPVRERVAARPWHDWGRRCRPRR